MKQSSSCPSLFSRIYETNNAFREVGALIHSKGLSSFNGSSIHHHIVSECLDLLELIFLYGKSPRLRTKSLCFNDWLKCNGLEKMIVNDLLIDKRLDKNPYWLLFYWDNQILGGLSPYTFVYTTPGTDFATLNLMGTNGNLLFGEECVSLLKRGKAFKEYMIANILDASKDTYSSEFKEYFRLCKRGLDTTTIPNIQELPLTNWREIGQLDPYDMCHNIYIANPHHNSDYKIKSSKVQTEDDSPLLLTPDGIQGALYWREMTWNPERMILGDSLNPDITQRELPGTADIYPFLTIDDLLEDKIIELTRINNPDKDHFFFVHVEERSFLIPVKPIYFQYFTSSDLQNQISVKAIKDEIEVQLTVPLLASKYKNKVIKKCYGKNGTIVFEDFFFAMTPSRDFHNIFIRGNIYKTICSHPLRLIESSLLNCKSNSYTKNQESGLAVLRTDSNPDVVVICGDNASGIIIVHRDTPFMSFTSDIVFSVDCTTDNIAIAYSSNDCYQRIVDETTVMNSILVFDQGWRSHVSDEILRIVKSEFIPILESNPPSLLSHLYENYCERLGWMMRNIAIDVAGTNQYRTVIVHNTLMPIIQQSRLRYSWEKGITLFDEIDCKMDLVLIPSTSAIFRYVDRRDLCSTASTKCIELGKEKCTISYRNADTGDKVITKQALFSTSFFWGIHNDYISSSDFVDDIISKYTTLYEQTNGSLTHTIISARDMSKTPFHFLLWLERHSNDISHFWDYIRLEDQVRFKALIYFASILFHLQVLSKKGHFQLSGNIFFCGPGTEILHLLGDEVVLSKFSNIFLSEATGSTTRVQIVIISSHDYKSLGGIDSIQTQLIPSEILLDKGEIIDCGNVEGMKNICMDEIQKFISILGNKFLLRKIYEFFNLKPSGLNTMIELANDSFDYHIKDIIESQAYETPYLMQEDLFFVPLMDFFSYSKDKPNSFDKENTSPVKDEAPIHDAQHRRDSYSIRRNRDVDLIDLQQEYVRQEQKKEYDIFISYRRLDEHGNISGRDQARLIAKELILKGYRPFFDYSEIKDNEFDEIIIPAIENCKVFILVLTKDALNRCRNENDWVRREIETALKSGIKIINVSPTPDNSFNDWPKSLPESLHKITKIQISDIHFGSLFEMSIEKLIADRISPTIPYHSPIV